MMRTMGLDSSSSSCSCRAISLASSQIFFTDVLQAPCTWCSCSGEMACRVEAAVRSACKPYTEGLGRQGLKLAGARQCYEACLLQLIAKQSRPDIYWPAGQ